MALLPTDFVALMREGAVWGLLWLGLWLVAVTFGALAGGLAWIALKLAEVAR